MLNVQNYSLCVCTACAQGAYNPLLASCITLAHTHNLFGTKAAAVHKLPSYSLYTALLILLFTHWLTVLINSVKTILIPIVHRPYIQNNNLLLMNI